MPRRAPSECHTRELTASVIRIVIQQQRNPSLIRSIANPHCSLSTYTSSQQQLVPSPVGGPARREPNTRVAWPPIGGWGSENWSRERLAKPSQATTRNRPPACWAQSAQRSRPRVSAWCSAAYAAMRLAEAPNARGPSCRTSLAGRGGGALAHPLPAAPDFTRYAAQSKNVL